MPTRMCYNAPAIVAAVDWQGCARMVVQSDPRGYREDQQTSLNHFRDCPPPEDRLNQDGASNPARSLVQLRLEFVVGVAEGIF